MRRGERGTDSDSPRRKNASIQVATCSEERPVGGSQLAAPDSTAWEQLLSHRAGTASFEEPLWAQHSEPVAEPESSILALAAAASSKEVAPAQHSEPFDVRGEGSPHGNQATLAQHTQDLVDGIDWFEAADEKKLLGTE
eukprot:7307941-Prymnesium_polylepis.1